MKNMEKTRKLLNEGKRDLVKSFDSQLENVKATKEELEQFSEQLKDEPKHIQEHIKKHYNIRKILQNVNKEADLHDEIDRAISFLDNLLKHTA